MRSWISAVVVACAAVLSSPAGEAQEARGTLQGRVFDATGAAVPGATVEIANVNTGVTTSTTSNDEGNYRVPFLNPGTYRVTVTLDGFSKFVSQNVELHVADVLTVDATLQAGRSATKSRSAAAAAVVDHVGRRTRSGRRRAQNLRAADSRRHGGRARDPGAGRRRTPPTCGRARRRSTTGCRSGRSDGAGEKRNDFTIDGVANVAADRVAYSPPSAAVEEFKIQTATYDAAVGNAMGASVNLVTKSGTNSLRGQVYEWFRGATLDANNFFDAQGRPPQARLQGQPIRRRGRRSDRAQPDVLFRERRGQPVRGAHRR